MKGLLFTYGLTYVGASLSLFSPFIGLQVYVAFAILRPDYLWSWSVPPGNYSRIVALGLLGGWMINGFGKWQFGKASPIVWTLVSLLICATLSAQVEATFVELAFSYILSLAKIVLPFVVGMTTIDSLKKVKQLAWVIVMCQGYVAYEMNLSYFQGTNRIWEDGFATLDNNGVAVAMNACMGLALFLGLHSPAWWQKGLAFAALAAMGHAVLLSFSRAGMLAMGLTGICCFFLIRKNAIHYAALVVVCVIGFRLAGEEVRERFMTTFNSAEERDESADSRLRLWSKCVTVMLESPILGIGPDDWPTVAHLHGFTVNKQAHTTWLRVGAELGVTGLLCLALFYGFTMKRLWGVLGEKGIDPWYQYLASGVIASCVGFVVSAQFASLEFLEVPYYVVLVGASLLKLLSTGETVEATETAKVRTLPAYAA